MQFNQVLISAVQLNTQSNELKKELKNKKNITALGFEYIRDCQGKLQLLEVW